MNDVVGVEGVDTITVVVPDIPKATIFYRDVLGLSFSWANSKMAYFNCGGMQLMLSSEAAGPVGGTLVTYRVADFEAAARALKRMGMVFFAEPHRVSKTADSESWMMALKDPGRNIVILKGLVQGGDSSPHQD